MTEEPVGAVPSPNDVAALEALAALRGVEPTPSVDDLALDVWDSDDELEAFLDDVRRSRRADVA